MKICSKVFWGSILGCMASLSAKEINTHHFRVNAPGKSSFTFIETNELVPSYKLGANWLFGFSDNILELTDQSGNELFSLIDERYYSDIAVSVGISRFNFGLSLPVVFYQQDPGRPVAGISSYSNSGIGNLRTFLKFLAFGEAKKFWSLGFMLDMDLPLSTADFSGSPDFGGSAALLIDYRSKYFDLSSNAGFAYFPHQEFLNLDTGMAMKAAVGASVHLSQKPALSLTLEQLLRVEDLKFKETQMPMESNASLSWRIIDEFSVAGGYGRSFTSGFGGAEHRAFLNFRFHPKERSILEKAWKANGIEILRNQIICTTELKFYPETDVLTEKSNFSLDAIAETIRRNPWITKVDIRVSNIRGESAASLFHLASRRAQKIMSELQSRGIPSSRLSSQGVLSSRKVDENSEVEEFQDIDFFFSSKESVDRE